MGKSNIFVGCMVSFATGIFLLSRFESLDKYIFILIIFGIIAFIFNFYFNQKHRKFILLAILFLLATISGMWRLQHYAQSNQFKFGLNSKSQWDGVIVEDIDTRVNKQQLTFKPFGYSQKLLIVTDKRKHFNYGDRITVSGKAKYPDSSDDFDYGKYLRRYNVYAIVSYPKNTKNTIPSR